MLWRWLSGTRSERMIVYCDGRWPADSGFLCRYCQRQQNAETCLCDFRGREAVDDSARSPLLKSRKAAVATRPDTGNACAKATEGDSSGVPETGSSRDATKTIISGSSEESPHRLGDGLAHTPVGCLFSDTCSGVLAGRRDLAGGLNLGFRRPCHWATSPHRLSLHAQTSDPRSRTAWRGRSIPGIVKSIICLRLWRALR